MTITILYSHPNPQSFAAAIQQHLSLLAQAKGHEVILRDLYAMNFDPVLKPSDFAAMQSGQIPADIQTEHRFIASTDLLLVIYPLWWTGMPALLKGYIDRIFSYGFAYKYENGVPIGLLKGKKAFIVTNTGTSTAIYEAMDMHQALNKTTNTGIFEFCGIEVVEHIYNGNARYTDDATRKGYLVAIEKAFERWI